MQEQLAKTAEETKANFNAFERNDLKLREVCICFIFMLVSAKLQ
jgi:hypothetical protein